MTDRSESRIASAVLVRLNAASLVIIAVWLGAVPARAEPKAPIAGRVPAEGLVVYLEYDGIDSHRKAWEATAASAIIDRTPTGAMAAEVSRQVLDQVLKAVPDAKVHAGDLTSLLRDAVGDGFALAIYGRGEDSFCGVLVCRGLGREDARRRLEKVRLGLLSAGEDPKPLPAVKIRGRDVYQPATSPAPDAGAGDGEGKAAPVAASEPSQSFWFEGNDLFVVFSNSSAAPAEAAEGEVAAQRERARPTHRGDLDAVFDAIDGKAKSVSTHDGYITAIAEGKDVNGFEADGLCFVDLGGKSGLLKGMLEGVGAMSPLADSTPASGLSLPSGRYLRDDDQLIPPGPPGERNVVPSGAELNDEAAQAPERPLPPQPIRPCATTDGNADDPPGPEHPLKPDEKGKAGQALKEEAPKEIDAIAMLGLRGIKQLIIRWGFQGKGLVTVVRLEIPAPREGLMALIDQPSFRKDRLPPIPRRVTSFAIGSFDPARGYAAIVAQAKKALGAEADALLEAGEKAVQDVAGVRLREDLLAHIGPTWCTYDLAEGSNDRSQGLSPGQVVVVGLRDAEAFAKVLDTVAARVNRSLRELETGGKDAGAGAQDRDPPALLLERLPAPDRGYQLTSPAGLVLWLDEDLRPTVLVGKSHVVVAANAELARAVLAAEAAPGSNWRAEGEVARTLADLPAELTSLSVADAADSALPEMIAKLPAYVQLLGNLLDQASIDSEAGPVSAILGLAGVPRPSGFRVRLDPSKLPKASAVRAHLFPSVLATTVDDRGLRWISREAFPFAAVASAVPVKPKFKIDLTQPVGSRLKFDMDVLGVKTK
ncbi:MAG: hypothetical protein P4L84_34265 [Isosphaeraceae bacterium]|nr:hypothetical protein [Isosphaeraceae bacterium]